MAYTLGIYTFHVKPLVPVQAPESTSTNIPKLPSLPSDGGGVHTVSDPSIVITPAKHL